MKTLAKPTSLLVGAAISIALALPAAAQDAETPSADMVLATVNGEEITLGHVMVMFDTLDEDGTAPATIGNLNGVLDYLIEQVLFSRAAGELSKATEIKLENAVRSIRSEEHYIALIAEAIDDEAIQETYDAAFADYVPAPEWNASHILVETEDGARALLEEVEAGADFAEMAREHSTGPSGPNGGQLGWFSPGMMVEPFETAVAEMEDGDVAGPVQTQFGWHLIKLNESKLQSAPTLDDVRTEIVSALEAEAIQQAMTELNEGATIERADIEVLDPAVLKDTSLLD